MGYPVTVDVVAGNVEAIGVPVTSVDQLIISSDGMLHGWSLREASGDTPSQVTGQVVSPGAGATIAQLTGLAAGQYNVTWQVELTGAAAAGDANNFQLKSSSGQTFNSVNAGAAGQYAQIQAELTVGANGTISVVAIAAGTAGVTYGAQIAVEPLAIADAVVELQDGNNPLGEISLGANQSQTQWFGDNGVVIANRINLHVVSGVVTGAVFCTYNG